jgi:hypothetical protein
MEQEDNVELLETFKGETVEDIEYTSDANSDLIKITFKNQESFVITGDLMIYLAFPKDMEFH